MTQANWAGSLDLNTASENVRGEFFGDWYHDPWGWPELDFLLKNPKYLNAHIEEGRAFTPAQIDVPKENWGARPAVVLAMEDRLAYQALVDSVSVDLIGNLHNSTYGWRLRPSDPKKGEYSRNDLQWKVYRSHLSSASWHYEAGLRTDLVSCFASIPLEPLQQSLEHRLRKNRIQDSLINFVGQMYKTPGRTGLPQRSTASAVIANMFLAPLDDVLDHHASEIPQITLPNMPKPRTLRSWTRWMDDIWLFGQDAGTMRKAQIELQQEAAAIGMHINSAKTEVFEGSEVAEHALQIEHSAVEGALLLKNTKPIEELVDRLLDDPTHAPRTSLRFVTNRMRDRNLEYRIEDFNDLANRMPHAADSLAPLLRDTREQGDLVDWFLDYARSPWASYDWAVAQYIRMFPNDSRPPERLLEYVADQIANPRTPLVLFAICAQRLAAWDRNKARGVLTSIEREIVHPQVRRTLSLAGISSSIERHKIKRWLSGHPDNRNTLAMLEEHNFRTPKVSSHYSE